MEDYSEDMAGFRKVPAAVVKPESEEQVQEIVRIAARHRIPLIPRGGGSSLTGAVVGRGALILDLSKMNRILKVDLLNWYVHCEVGLVLEDLNAALEPHGFFFPPDPSSSPLCTVGGIIAECAGGMKCVKYGTVKDWVYALKAVLANGEIVKLGEPLPKNRSGYDLMHLLVGSEGTLAVVTQAWLKIIPKPMTSIRRLLVHFDSWDSVGVTIQRFRASRIIPRIMEFMDRGTVSAVNQGLDAKIQESEATLLVDIEEDVAGALDYALRIFKECGAASIVVAKDQEEEERFYSARVMAYPAIKSLASGVMVEDVVVPVDRLVEYLVFVKRLASKRAVRILVNGHIGDGNVHPVILYDKRDRKSLVDAKKVFEEICRYAIKVGGSVSGEHGIGVQKVKFFREQVLQHGGIESLKLMKKVKKMFDPHGILNPNKYVEAA